MTNGSPDGAAHPRTTARPLTAPEPRRALILAGGGLKVAYQAGVLQVWLDEAGLRFDLADGASGGVLNLALWCQGRTGTQIADAWRGYRPLRAVTLNLPAWLRGPFGESLLSGAGIRDRLFPDLGIDWHLLKTSGRTATFNLYDVSNQEHLVLTPDAVTRDVLRAAVSLPGWFPPVRVGSDVLLDGVFATDANLEEALRRGADELWVVWTVSTRGRWRPGVVPEYFAVIEAVANSRLRAVLDRIERNNAERRDGRDGEFGRDVTVRLISAEVPVHYLLVFRRVTIARAVELGVRDARRWCEARGHPVRPVPAAAAPPGSAGVSFREVLAGTLRRPTPPDSAGSGEPFPLRLLLHVSVDDVNHFAADPDHPAALSGWVESPGLGRLPVRRGRLHLLVDVDGEKQMRYDVELVDVAGRVLRVHGTKHVPRAAKRTAWPATTTLHTTVEDGAGEQLASGLLRLTPAAFAHQLTTFRSSAPHPLSRLAAVARFGLFFAGGMWEVYGPPTPPPARPAPWLREVLP